MQKFRIRIKQWREGTATVEVEDDWTDDTIQEVVEDLKDQDVDWDPMFERDMLGVQRVP